MIDHSNAISPAALAAVNEVSQWLLRVVRPFFWQVKGRILNGASAFVLRFEERYVAVTADHVIAQYLSALDHDPSVRCQLRECWVSPNAALISRSQALDLATFEVDPVMLPKMGAEAVDCRSNWPPPPVLKGDTLSLAGFLDGHRHEQSRGYYEHRAYGGHAIVDDVTARNIVVTYSPEEVCATNEAVQKPPLKFNMSGCSGGLAVLVRRVGDKIDWVPSGLIYKGSGDQSGGGFAEFDLIHLRPLSFIRTDGTVDDPNVGWLPH